jgi:hypothetical protein
LWPMDATAMSGQAQVGSLGDRAVSKPRIPCHRRGDGSTVQKVDDNTESSGTCAELNLGVFHHPRPRLEA